MVAGVKGIEDTRRTASDLGNRWIMAPIPKLGTTGGTIPRDKMISSILNILSLRCLI